MDVTFWGTRGSLPRATSNTRFLELLELAVDQAKQQGITSLDQFVDAAKSGQIRQPFLYGGNTSCTEITANEQTLFIDSGSGIAWAGDAAMAQGKKEFHLFQTHFHWDHIIGLPFFVPIYIPGHHIKIYHVHKTAERDLKIQWNGRNFPVKWDQLGATVEFVHIPLYESIEIDSGVKVSPFALDHPGGSFGYRVEADGSSIIVGVDGEYKRFSQKDLGKDLAYYQNLDCFVFDAQYEVEELASRYDWGHCTPQIGVDIALREGIRNLVLTHHDPRSTDEKTTRMHEGALAYRDKKVKAVQKQWESLGQPGGPNIYSAYDGMKLTLDQSGARLGLPRR